VNRRLCLISVLIAVCFVVITTQQPALAVTNESTCSQFGLFSVDGGYNVQNNAFNLPAGATQCINADSSGTDWNVTTNASVATNGAPSGYPDIYAGCHFGTCSSNQQGMPIQECAISSAPSAWNVTPSSNGNWDIAYDIWFNPNMTTPNNSTGLEMMIWINNMGTIQPAGSVAVSGVSIDGMTWDIWKNQGSVNTGTITYKVTTTTNSVSFDLLPFFQDMVSRGYLSSDQFLIAVEAGTEIWTPGSGFATNSFSVSVSNGGGRCNFPPLAPKGLTAGAGNGLVALGWTASSGATSYNVLRSTTSGGPYTKIASGVTSTNFTDTGLTNGTTYFYVVQAVNVNGASGNSNQASAAPTVDISFLRGSNHQSGGGGPHITTALPNNAGDVLVVACREGADFTSISSVTDTAGNSYSLVNHSSSDAAGAKREAAVFLANRVVASSSNTVSCNFASSLSTTEAIVVLEFANAFGLDSDTTSSTGSTTATSLASGSITTTQNGDALIYAVTTGADTTFTAGSGYTIPPSASTGRLVAEYEIDGAAGSKSTTLSWSGSLGANGIFLAIKGIIPAPPTNLTATTISSTQINLSWTASSNADSYDVFRSTTSGFTPGAGNQIASGVTSTSFSDTGLTASTTYYYVVEACNNSGCSTPSNQASATTLSILVNNILSRNPAIGDKIQSLTGMTAAEACSGFGNLGQCSSAAQVSHDLGISFVCLRSDLTGIAPPSGAGCPAGTGSTIMSLGEAIQALAP
jgi:glycosyl hydrolase family 12/fibronectin type III domain protein